MESPSLEVLTNIANGIIDGLLVMYVPPDLDESHITLIMANKASAKGGSHVFPNHIGQTVSQIYQKPLEELQPLIFIQAWKRVATTHNSETHPVEYQGESYDSYFFYVGDNCVAVIWRNTTESVKLQARLNKLQNRLSEIQKKISDVASVI